ncbi:unnamed protein product [Arabis nemorensis]|uniref:BRO1 domain-containing protein n=1 Tax=Arabis nemorensis TaxID=586526 RepID=A0A565APR7_9BRAS|nr:unnamed protein product [Arabis nemorensis]
MASSALSNLMLAIHEKKTTSVDLYRPLRNYVTFTYSEREAQLLEDDLESLKQLRSDVERVPDPSPAARRDLLISYYKALCLVETRFPISPEKHHVNAVSFLWYDAFKQKHKSTQQNINLEKAAVLFNLGATYSQIGLGHDRTTVDGRRQASHAFMAAAGAFAYVRDNESTKATMGQSCTVDLSVECVGMLERLMLAQAQECVFENTIAKGSSPGVCAKIARQVGIFYEEALAQLNCAPLKDHFEKGWITHVQMKAALFYSEACYRYGIELHEKEEIAEEIARLRSGSSRLAEAKKSSRGAPAQLLEAINKLEASINCNLDRAVKENDRVYLMRVPSPASLSPLPTFSMVKPMNMTEILDASKEKMFAILVPDSSAKALSRYTEMVDDVIRTQAERLQQASELTRVRLKEMDLPDSILAVDGSSTLPVDLKEDVEAVQINGGPAGLEAELQQLRDLKRVNHELLVHTEELLQKEATEDAQFRSQFGTRWTRPQSSTLTKNLQDRLNRFAANLKQAGESDVKIERSVRDNSALMSILDQRPIESAVPTLARPIMSLDATEDAIVGTLKQSLRQLENLGAQRAGLEDMLKEMKRKDDILPKLMTITGSYEDMFRKEISKYDHICQDISQNIEVQEQLLMQIQAQNEEFATLFNLEDYKASREKCYKQIQAAIAKYREIKENINEGLKFYVTLQDAITNVKQQCSDFVMTRSIQCREMMEDVQRQMSGLSFQDHRNSGPYPSVHQPAVSSSPPPPESQNPSHHHPQAPYYRPPEQHSRPGYNVPPYGPLPPYHTPHGQAPPPHGQAPPQYPPQGQQQPYPSWQQQGSYYDPHGQQPRPPYTAQNPYPPPNQGGGYYRQ